MRYHAICVKFSYSRRIVLVLSSILFLQYIKPTMLQVFYMYLILLNFDTYFNEIVYKNKQINLKSYYLSSLPNKALKTLLCNWKCVVDLYFINFWISKMKITMIILFLEEKKLQFGKKSVSVIHCITGLEITGRKDAECVCFFHICVWKLSCERQKNASAYFSKCTKIVPFYLCPVPKCAFSVFNFRINLKT